MARTSDGRKIPPRDQVTNFWVVHINLIVIIRPILLCLCHSCYPFMKNRYHLQIAMRLIYQAYVRLFLTVQYRTIGPHNTHNSVYVFIYG